MRIESDRKDYVDSSISFYKRASYFILVYFCLFFTSWLFFHRLISMICYAVVCLKCWAYISLTSNIISLLSFTLLTSPLFITIDERRGEERRPERTVSMLLNWTDCKTELYRTELEATQPSLWTSVYNTTSSAVVWYLGIYKRSVITVHELFPHSVTSRAL